MFHLAGSSVPTPSPGARPGPTRRRRSAIAALASLGVIASGCSSTAGAPFGAPGVNQAHKTILIGALSPTSGPASVVGDPLTAGEQSYFDWLDATGGLDGWKVYLTTSDTQNQPALAASAFRQLRSYTLFVGQAFGGAVTEAIDTSAKRDGVLIGLATTDSALLGGEINAGITTSEAADTANAVDYAVRHLRGARPGIIYPSSPSGADALKGFLAAVRTSHLGPGPAASYPAKATAFTAEVRAMAQAQANIVVLSGLPSAVAGILATADALGYRPKWLLVGDAWSEYLMSVSGLPGGPPTQLLRQLTGSWVVEDEAPWGAMAGAPGMVTFLQAQQTFYPEQVPDPYFMLGYCLGEMEGALLRKGIVSHNLSRPAIVADRLGLGRIDFGGLLPAITYRASSGPVSDLTRLYQVNPAATGFLAPLTGYFTTRAAAALEQPSLTPAGAAAPGR